MDSKNLLEKLREALIKRGHYSEKQPSGAVFYAIIWV